MMNHDLALSDLYVKAVLECREHGWDLTWKNSRMLELKKLGVEPDAYLKVESPHGSREAFIEYTAVLPTRTELDKRLEAYQRLYERTGRTIPILWFATTASKLNWLRSSAGSCGCAAFGLVAEKYLSSSIWWWGSEQVRFIQPKEET
jgi:hypothetical protein